MANRRDRDDSKQSTDVPPMSRNAFERRFLIFYSIDSKMFFVFQVYLLFATRQIQSKNLETALKHLGQLKKSVL